MTRPRRAEQTAAEGDASRGWASSRTVLHALGVLLLLAVLAPFVVQAVPQTVGADQSYTVLSGSMEPSISPGDVVVVDDVGASTLERGDVITFRRDGETKPTTHRIVEIRETETGRAFVTKGDANEARDGPTVAPENVVGEVLLVIPLVGYVVQFAGTRLGFAALVGAPIALLVVSEVWKVVTSSSAEATDGRTDEAQPTTDTGAADPSDSNDPEDPNDSDEFELELPDLRVALVPLVALTVYSAVMAYTTRTPWSVAVAVASGGFLLLGGGLSRMAEEVEEVEEDDPMARDVETSPRDTSLVPVTDASLPDGGPRRVVVDSAVSLVDVAAECGRPIRRDEAGERLFVRDGALVFVWDGTPPDDASPPADRGEAG
ncbi:signal peptidase, endoplasmic reticulum-type [Halogranum gelatinilyticum]|uniref:Signal peptidase, endoplasmic reticulum-type n=1 Tax=Halogranum gelatinilyticum TaxID=660521 RepID=A0A1G9QWZ4_9EURY|nr:signal peptidase I [Halogranum gelatinilyticum]SDM15380.1 signal peptidase, endoplasmic reticulum-type [Halogranum gelatinilyticum]